MRFRHPLFEQAEEAFDLLLLIETPQADAIGILSRDHQARVVSQQPEVVVHIVRTHDRRFANLFNNGNSVVGVYELFPDFESHFRSRQMQLLSDNGGLTEGSGILRQQAGSVNATCVLRAHKC